MEVRAFIDICQDDDIYLKLNKERWHGTYVFYNLLYYLKEKYKIKVTEFAKVFGVSRQRVYQYFKTNTNDLPMRIKEMITKAYNVKTFEDVIQCERDLNRFEISTQTTLTNMNKKKNKDPKARGLYYENGKLEFSKDYYTRELVDAVIKVYPGFGILKAKKTSKPTQEYIIEKDKNHIQKRIYDILKLPSLISLKQEDFDLLGADTHIHYVIKKEGASFFIKDKEILKKQDLIIAITYKNSFSLGNANKIIESVKKAFYGFSINIIIGIYINNKLSYPKVDIFL